MAVYRPARAGRATDVSRLIAPDAERQVLAGIIDLVDRDTATAREISAGLTVEMLPATAGAAELLTATQESLAAVAGPTYTDLLAALRRGGCDQGSDAHTLLVDLAGGRIGTGPSAARLAREAAVELKRLHEQRLAVEAAALVVASSGRPEDVAGLIRHLDRVRAATADCRPMTLAAALDAWEATPDTPRIVTGFPPLDELAGGGLPCGTMTVLAGRPGAGKSALALQACIGAMLQDSTLPVLWGLGEMSPEALACRSVAVGSVLLGRDPVTLTRAGRRSASARAVAEELRRDLGGRLHIVVPLTLDRIEAAVVATGAKMLVVDYLQLVRVDGAADRRQEVDAVVKALRELTLTHGLVTLAVSNIAKTVGRDSRIGSIAKESSEVDFAADVLLLGEPADDEDEHGMRPVRWRCLKNRHGRPCDIEATFDGSLQVFTAPEAEPFPEFAGFSPRGTA
jgi:replicative DNA helicase